MSISNRFLIIGASPAARPCLHVCLVATFTGLGNNICPTAASPVIQRQAEA